MSEPRAQRNVAPTNLRRAGAARARRYGAGLRRPATRSSCSLTRLSRREPRRCRELRPPPSARRHPTRSIGCASPHDGCASRCGCSGRMLPSKDVARFRAELRWFASSLGDVRDLDVYTRQLQSLCVDAAARAARRLERLSSCTCAASAPKRASARRPRSRARAQPRCSTRPRAFRRSRAERGRAAPLALALGARRRPRQASAAAPVAFAGSATGLDARAAPRSCTSCASRRSACATSSSSSRRCIRHSSRRPRNAKRFRTCSARIKTRTRPPRACAVTRTLLKKQGDATAPCRPRSCSCAAVSSRSRARCARSFAGEWPEFRRHDRRRAATRCLTAGTADA